MGFAKYTEDNVEIWIDNNRSKEIPTDSVACYERHKNYYKPITNHSSMRKSFDTFGKRTSFIR